MAWWVGAVKGKYYGPHEVVQCDAPTEEMFPNYDFMEGPFEKKADAEVRAGTLINKTGMFMPFPGDPR